jgi:hypothetical protein
MLGAVKIDEESKHSKKDSMDEQNALVVLTERSRSEEINHNAI